MRADVQRRALEDTALKVATLAKAVAEGSSSSPDTLLIAIERLRAEVKVCRILCSTIARTEGVGDI